MLNPKSMKIVEEKLNQPKTTAHVTVDKNNSDLSAKAKVDKATEKLSVLPHELADILLDV